MQIKKNLHITFGLIITMVMMYIFYKINNKIFEELFVLKSSNLSNIYIWQFVTYVFYFQGGPFFFFFNVMIFFYFSSTLENLWGSFHFGIYLTIVILSRSISSFLFGPLPLIGHWSLYLSLMVAFGFNMPEEKIFLFFVIPIRVKTLAIISAAFIPIQIILSMVYPSGIEGFLKLPLTIGVLLSGTLSYIAILIYFRKIFDKRGVKIESVINNLQKVTDKINAKTKSEDIKNSNNHYLNIYKKIDGDITLEDNEKKLIEEISTDFSDLCESDDFNESDNYCLTCDKYKKCIKREIKPQIKSLNRA